MEQEGALRIQKEHRINRKSGRAHDDNAKQGSRVVNRWWRRRAKRKACAGIIGEQRVGKKVIPPH